MKGLYRLFLLIVLLLPIVSTAQTPTGAQEKTVSCCSLSFAYADAPDRPVSEFDARVVNRDKSKNYVRDQKCSSTLEYEPGNYHLTIKTLPQIDRNIDLDMDEQVIVIPQPGLVKFVSDEKAATVILYKQEEDRFTAFDTLTLNGLDAQPLAIQPGEYQVHYHAINSDPSAPEKIATFYIKATKEKIVKLNKQ